LSYTISKLARFLRHSVESWGYPTVKTAWSYLESFWHSASVWRTDRRTDGFTIANTALCIASYADAL